MYLSRINLPNHFWGFIPPEIHCSGLIKKYITIYRVAHKDETLRTYWNQFSLGEFVNKNRCLSVRLVSEEVKSIKFDNFDNSHNSFLWPEYFIDYLCERWIPCQASTSFLCLYYRPMTVHCSTKDAYTYKITFLALNPCVVHLNFQAGSTFPFL